MSITIRQSIAAKHLKQLCRAGMPLDAVAARTGIHPSTLQEIARGTIAKPAPSLEIRILAVSARPGRAPRANSAVSARGAIRRLQALGAVGWSLPAIASLFGWSVSGLEVVMTASTISRRQHELIAAAFDLLWNRQPSDPIDAAGARAYARNRNWASPLAWDDIDSDPRPSAVAADSAEQQVDGREPSEISEANIALALSGVPVTLSVEEQVIAVARLKKAEVEHNAIAELLHIGRTSVTRRWRQARAEGLAA